MRSREPRSYVTHEADVIGDRAHFAQLDDNARRGPVVSELSRGNVTLTAAAAFGCHHVPPFDVDPFFRSGSFWRRHSLAGVRAGLPR